jgi:hypothetical protein
MRLEFEKLLARNDWGHSDYLLRCSYYKNDVFFVPEKENSGYFVKVINKKVILLSPELFDLDCIKEILKYSNRTYKDWIEELIRDNQKQINTLQNEIEAHEQLLLKDS